MKKKVNSIAFSPDGSKLASGYSGFDITLQIWDLKNEHQIYD